MLSFSILSVLVFITINLISAQEQITNNQVNQITNYPIATFSPEEKAIIQEFKNRILENSRRDPKDIETGQYQYNLNYLENTPDSILYNWIFFYEFDMEKSDELIRKSLAWRKTNNIDYISEWQPPEFIKRGFPFKISGFTDELKPIIYMNAGRYDLRGAVNNGLRNDVAKYMIYVIESVLREVQANSKNSTIKGQRPGNFIIIADMDGLEFRQVTSLRVLGLMAQVLGILQANYPYFHQDAIVINSSSLFSVLLDVAKSVLSSKSFDRIYVFSDKKEAANYITKVVPFRAIPSELGGPA